MLRCLHTVGLDDMASEVPHVLSSPPTASIQPQALVDDRWFEDVAYFHVGNDRLAGGCGDGELTDDFCNLCKCRVLLCGMFRVHSNVVASVRSAPHPRENAK